ncbi:MAG: tetratricopeptide repeat protein [Bacteroidota bacterium]
MRSFILLISLGLIPLFLQAQAESDSLREVWYETTLPDSQRLNAAIDLMKQYRKTGNYPAISQMEMPFLVIAKQPGFEAYLSQYYVLIAKGPFWHNLKDSETILLKSINISEKADNKRRQAVEYNTLGKLYTKFGQYAKAINAYNQAGEISQKIGYDKGYTLSLTGIGICYRDVGNYAKAIEYFTRAEQAAQQNGLAKQVANAYGYIGDVYRLTKDYPNALTYYLKDLGIMEKTKEKRFLSSNYFKVGLTYNLMGQHSEALRYAQEALDASTSNNDLLNKSLSLYLFGEIYKDKGSYTTSINYFSQSLELERQMKSQAGMAKAYYEIGDTYLGQGKYRKAIENCLLGQGLFARTGRVLEEESACSCLYQAYKAQGRLKPALLYLEKRGVLRDSLNKQDAALRLQQMEFSRQIFADSITYEREKLELKVGYNEQIRRKDRVQSLLVAIGLISLIILGGLWYRIRLIRQNEAALEAKNRVIEAEKVKAQASEKAKHLFLANMSHEIRTPMNAIKGMTDILLRRAPKTEQLEFLRAIKQSSASLLVIINDILDLSKIEADKITLENTPFSPAKVIENVHTIMNFKAEEKGLTLKTEITGDIPTVMGDPTRMGQILINLVGNAIKFTEKGCITLRLENLEQTPEQVRLQFTVQDTGIGIDPKHATKIFESFEQEDAATTRKFGGTGLGLSISQKLAALSGGTIWVESEVGQGSTFFVSIPFTIAKEAMVTVPEQIETQPPQQRELENLHVLLVEDNAFNAMVAQEELEDAIEGITVDLAENGEIAVNKVREHAYDLVLMDVQMPVMGGYEATQQIRELGSPNGQIPILAMTANVLEEEVARCYDCGMNDFIGKPFDTDELVQKISTLVAS